MQAAEMKMREALGLGGRRDAGPARQPQDAPRPQQHRPMADRPAGNGHRHRFVQDGEVPVVLVSHASGAGSPAAASRGTDQRTTNPRGLAAVADASADRAARERAERQAQQAQATIRDLETKLAHADMARAEALTASRNDRAALAALGEDMRARLAALTAELAAERTAREFAESALREALTTGRRQERAVRIVRASETGGRMDHPMAEGLPAPVKRKRAEPADKPMRAATHSKSEPKPVKWWVRGAKG